MVYSKYKRRELGLGPFKTMYFARHSSTAKQEGWGTLHTFIAVIYVVKTLMDYSRLSY